MSAVSFIDQSGVGIFPSDAILTLRRKHPSQRAYRYFGSLIDVSGGQGYGRSINLGARQAVLMMGTTPELQAELAAAIADQVNGVFVQDDYLVIYYLRYAEGTFSTTNRTVACIAGRRHYWGVPDDQNDTNVQNSGWALLCPTGADQWIFNGSMSLQTLHDVLGRLHHTESWYNESGERIR
jgi:hypothetical protein